MRRHKYWKRRKRLKFIHKKIEALREQRKRKEAERRKSS